MAMALVTSIVMKFVLVCKLEKHFSKKNKNSWRGEIEKLVKIFFSPLDITLAKIENSQNGTFQPVHEIQKFFWPKAFFWSIMKMTLSKNFANMSQRKGDFLKKALARIEKLFLFKVPMNLRKAWKGKLEAASFFAF